MKQIEHIVWEESTKELVCLGCGAREKIEWLGEGTIGGICGFWADYVHRDCAAKVRAKDGVR